MNSWRTFRWIKDALLMADVKRAQCVYAVRIYGKLKRKKKGSKEIKYLYTVACQKIG